MAFSNSSSSSDDDAKTSPRILRQMPDLAPGDGHVDVWQNRFDEISDTADQMPEDESSKALRDAIVAAAGGGVRVKRFKWEMNDKFARGISNAMSGSLLASEQDRAASLVAPSGFGSVADRDAAVQSARQDVADRMTTATRNAVLAKTTDKGSALAAQWSASMQALQSAIESAKADATAPDAMKGSVTLEDILRKNELKTNLNAQEKPITGTLQRLQGYIDRGELDKADMLIPAARELATEFKEQAFNKLAPRFVSENTLTSERDRAFDLLKLIESYEATQVPASIRVAVGCFFALKDLFTEMVGASPRFMTPAKFANVIDFDADLANALDDLTIDDGWIGRHLAPNTPPGWSRPVMRSSGRGIVRLPAPPGDR
jgi:hypothetical protein